MMPQQGPLPPPRMNMANGSHGNPMNPNMMPGNFYLDCKIFKVEFEV